MFQKPKKCPLECPKPKFKPTLLLKVDFLNGLGFNFRVPEVPFFWRAIGAQKLRTGRHFVSLR